MLKDINENLEDLQKEKEEYYKNLGSGHSTSQAKSGWQSQAPSIVSKFSSEPNFYSMEEETKKRMSEIDARLL